MQRIVFKREFSVAFDAIKTENVHYLEEKIQPIKKIVIKKGRKKKFLRGVLTLCLGYFHTEFGINRTSFLDMSLYTQRGTDRQIRRKTLYFIIFSD